MPDGQMFSPPGWANPTTPGFATTTSGSVFQSQVFTSTPGDPVYVAFDQPSSWDTQSWIPDASGGTWTNASFIRFTNSGTGTVANLFNIPAALFVTSTATIAKTIKVVASDGTPYYIMCSSAA